MADDEQKQCAAPGMTMIASRVASICAMIDEHSAAGTTMSARRAAAISAMIDEVAAAKGVTCDGKRRRKRSMGNARCYEEMCRLGEGSFGIVIKARHRATGQIVALKELRMETCYDIVGDLLREACFMAACRGHPSLVGLCGVARTPGTGDYSLVMEYVGPTLHQVLEARMDRCGRAFPEASVRSIMRQLLTGAAVMHKHRIMHRDIKPENILVDANGSKVVKIGDYGTALSMEEKNPEAYWAAGTRSYSAPEMLLEKPDYDTLVDLWSLGCVMAELLTGKVLFKGAYFSDQLYKIFDVLGVPGKREWKAFKSSFLADEVQQWRQAKQQQGQNRNRLRELFPEELLSKDGFDVLNGLLTCNPYKRLAAAAAFQLPWFADTDIDAPVAAIPGSSAAAKAKAKA